MGHCSVIARQKFNGLQFREVNFGQDYAALPKAVFMQAQWHKLNFYKVSYLTKL